MTLDFFLGNLEGYIFFHLCRLKYDFYDFGFSLGYGRFVTVKLYVFEKNK